MQTVDDVTALIVCHIFSVTDRPGKGLAVPYLQTCGNCTVCVCVLIDLYLFSAFVRPFMLGVVTNSVENLGVTSNADISNRGFSLNYRQMPCE